MEEQPQLQTAKKRCPLKILTMVLAVTLVAVVALSIWKCLDSKNQIADLEQQVASLGDTTTASARYLEIPDFNVRFTIPKGVGELSYVDWENGFCIISEDTGGLACIDISDKQYLDYGGDNLNYVPLNGKFYFFAAFQGTTSSENMDLGFRIASTIEAL